MISIDSLFLLKVDLLNTGLMGLNLVPLIKVRKKKGSSIVINGLFRLLKYILNY